jgi:hypothetical protein
VSTRKFGSTVKDHLEQILTAFFLVEGEPKMQSSRQRAARRVTTFLDSIASDGALVVDRFCTECRTHALTGRNPRRRWVNRDPGYDRLFSASTLKRAIMWPIPQVDLERSEKQTVERFFITKEPLSVRVKKSIQEYFRILEPTLRQSRSDPCFPFPTHKACLEEKAGTGVLSALRAHAAQHAKRKVDGPGIRRGMATATASGRPGTRPDFSQTDFVRGKSDTMPIFLPSEAGLDWMTDMLAGAGFAVHTDNANSYSARASGVSQVTETKVPTTAREWADYVLDQLPSTPRKLKPLGLIESGRKIRVATLHDCITVHAARVLTRASLGPLKTLTCLRDILSGREIKLEPLKVKNTLLYSADLSAATDHISHELAKLLWDGYSRALRLPQHLHKAGHQILGPQLVEGYEDRGPTTCGVHMGLGLSWPLLCLVNGWAAWDAGARRDTYAVCGDDLIGNWDKKCCDRYEANLAAAGLVVNTSKSFRGPRGVFCERLVRTNKEGVAISHTCVTMAEAAAAKHGWGAGETWAAVSAHLEKVVTDATRGRRSRKDPLLPLANRSLQRIACRSAPTGPTAVSGRGGAPSEAQLAGVLITGGGHYRPPKSRRERDIYHTFAKELESRPTPWKGESLSRTKAHEVLVTAIGILKGKEKTKPKTHAPRYKDYARTGKSLVRVGKEALKEHSLADLVKHSKRLSSAVKRRILCRLRWRLTSHSRTKGFRRLLEMIKDGQPETHYRASELATLLGKLNLESPEAMGAFRRGGTGRE